MPRLRIQRAFVVALLAIPIVLILRSGFPVCPTASFFGIPCPGCGLTRATLAALSGDIASAIHFHPLVFILTPLLVWLLLAALFSYLREPSASAAPQKSILSQRTATILGSVLFVLVVGVWVSRFFGCFGGPVHVETLRSWAAKKLSTTPSAQLRTATSPQAAIPKRIESR